jgi:hypothetical protein
MKTQHLVEELESILAKDGKWIKNWFTSHTHLLMIFYVFGLYL